MKTDPRHDSTADTSAMNHTPQRQTASRAERAGVPHDGTNRQKKPLHNDSTTLLSADEIERVLRCAEESYGAELSSEIKKTMREEIATAVPELTKALLPIITAASEDTSDPNKLQQDWIRAFMGVMLPRMQKIVSSTPK
ncbi:hypothetical protein [Candidatus Anaplasma sp. TIGMIC]|uniref:hypothetical protein n=1 Tax=Candidatus Anaplasma sp. TIGMIC TaxID=3020713 RepID=UPI00232B2D59|nr:hypothetical protein [Candidatus Anaplasma sp. TIGMIC]MDB1135621.1 hypothetical protein [Candidatus Anaplasma sp. TIGMIC]